MKSADSSFRTYNSSYNKNLSYFEFWQRLCLDITSYKDLLWKYFVRDFVASYQQSILGILWKVILPLIPISVYIVLQMLGLLAGAQDMPRSLFVVAGMTFWQLFASVLSITVNRIEREAGLLKKVRVPLIVIYLSGVGQVLFDFFVRLFVLVGLLIYFKIEPNIYWLTLPLLFIPFVSLGLGVGMLVSYFAVYIKDVKNIVSIFITYGMFASSVIFPMPKTGLFSEIFYWNGVRHLIDASRDLLVFGTYTDMAPFWFTVVFSFLVLLFSVKKLYVVERQLVGAL